VAITNATLTAARRLRRFILQVNQAQASQLTRAWVDAWDALLPEFDAAITELIQAADGDMIPASVVSRSRRVQQALDHALDSLTELGDFTDTVVARDVPRVLLEAVDRHVEIILSQLPPQDIRVVNFARSDPNALAAIVERTTEQITSRTRPMPAEQANVMRAALVRGIALGEHPDAVARRILLRTEGAFAGGLSRAVNVARTELLDAHREAARRNAMENRDILSGWIWQANLDANTCVSCLANNGRVFPIDAPGPLDHPQGRCARVDKTKSWADLGFEGFDEPEDLMPDARAWFDNLTEDQQRQIMGSKRLDMFKAGDIGWDDMTTLKQNPGWRDSQVVTPLSVLAG
jgi:hypothetical protein